MNGPVEGGGRTRMVTTDNGVVASPADSVLDATGESFAGRYRPIDWHELWATASGSADWLIDGVLERGRLHVIYAQRKNRKSLLTLIGMAAALASGSPLLGRPNPHARHLRVLYIDLENSRDDIKGRLVDAGYGPDDLSDLIYLSFPALPYLDTSSGGEHIARLVDHYRADVVVFDTTSRIVKGKEYESDTFRALYRCSLVPLKQREITVVRIDHAGKDLDRGQRGSSAKADDADTVWQLVKRSDDRLTLKCEAQRSGHHPEQVELVIRRDPLRFIRIDEAADRPEVRKLVDELDRLGVPREAGRDKARKALTDAEITAGNDVLAEALKIRKTCPDKIRTGAADDDL